MNWSIAAKTPRLLDAYGFYTVALNNALESKDPYESRDVGRAFLYPPMALVVIEPFHCISNSFTLVVTFMAVNVAMMVVMV